MAGSSRSVHVGRNIVSTRRGGDGRVERVAIAERKCERDRGRACTIFSCDSNFRGLERRERPEPLRGDGVYVIQEDDCDILRDKGRFPRTPGYFDMATTSVKWPSYPIRPRMPLSGPVPP
jgi:hypothetical protein